MGTWKIEKYLRGLNWVLNRKNSNYSSMAFLKIKCTSSLIFFYVGKRTEEESGEGGSQQSQEIEVGERAAALLTAFGGEEIFGVLSIRRRCVFRWGEKAAEFKKRLGHGFSASDSETDQVGFWGFSFRHSRGEVRFSGGFGGEGVLPWVI